MHTSGTNFKNLQAKKEKIKEDAKKRKKKVLELFHSKLVEDKKSTGDIETSLDKVTIVKSTPKTVAKKYSKDLLLVKDFYLTTSANNSPVKGRNLYNLSSLSKIPTKGIRNVTPNNRSVNNISLLNQTPSRMQSEEKKKNCHSPFLRQNKSRSLIERKESINTPKITTTIKNHPESNGNNSKFTSNLSKYSNLTKKKETLTKIGDSRSFLNVTANAVDKNKTKTISKSNSKSKSKSPLTKTINLNSKINNNRFKIDQLKVLINDLIDSKDEGIKEDLKNVIQAAYKRLFPNMNDEPSVTHNRSSILSSFSLEQQTDLYYTEKKESTRNKTISMPKLVLGLNSLKDGANKPKLSMNRKEQNNTNINTTSIMKDNFIHIKDSSKANSNSTKPGSNVNHPSLVLNLECLPKKDFNEEFMEHADDFSPSWREGCRQVNLFKQQN